MLGVPSVKLFVPVPMNPLPALISGMTPSGMLVAPVRAFRVTVPPVAAAALEAMMRSAPALPMSKVRVVVAELVVKPVPVPLPTMLNVPIAPSTMVKREPLLSVSDAPALVVVALPS